MSLYGRIEELEEQLAKWQESSANAAGEALALSHERDKLRKQNVLLRELLVIVQERGDLYSSDHDAIRKALDATADLAGLVVCDAVPVADVKKHTGEFKDMAIIVWCGEQPAKGTKLYKARSMK